MNNFYNVVKKLATRTVLQYLKVKLWRNWGISKTNTHKEHHDTTVQLIQMESSTQTIDRNMKRKIEKMHQQRSVDLEDLV